MRKQKKPKNVKLSNFVDEIKDKFLQKLAPPTVVIIFLAMMFLLVRAFLYGSDYFRLRTIETKAPFLDGRAAEVINHQVLSAHKGRNVFKINLKNIAQAVQNSYTDVKDVAVRIALPDKLVVSFKLRKPIALVRRVKYYPIDEDGVVLPGAGSVLFSNLPVIEGVDVRYNTAKGISRNLALALKLLQEIKSNRIVGAYGVASISAADPNNMSFSLKNGVEIRIGAENFKERLDLLEKTLKYQRLIMDNIKYIDVRFKDIIIGPK